ncbi:MAG: hypothetical protein JNK82_38505 [Myxococcaceae bacterium]|nr:hypothetical protein [Myxococcaceae bacterium]
MLLGAAQVRNRLRVEPSSGDREGGEAPGGNTERQRHHRNSGEVLLAAQLQHHRLEGIRVRPAQTFTLHHRVNREGRTARRVARERLEGAQPHHRVVEAGVGQVVEQVHRRIDGPIFVEGLGDQPNLPVAVALRVEEAGVDANRDDHRVVDRHDAVVFARKSGQRRAQPQRQEHAVGPGRRDAQQRSCVGVIRQRKQERDVVHAEPAGVTAKPRISSARVAPCVSRATVAT